MTARRHLRLLTVSALTGLFVIHVLPGCMPDLDALSSGNGEGGSNGGGTSTGGVTDGGGGARGGSGGSVGGGGVASGGGGVNGGGASGDGGAGGGAGEAGAGGGAGEAGVGGAGGASAGAGGSGGEQGGAAGSSGAGGEAGAACESGFTRCPGTSGCSTDLTVGDPDGSSVSNCGACGVTCSVENAQLAECETGTCAPKCSTGFDDCNANAVNDGCETAVTTISNCGACGHACVTTAAASTTCTAGRCAPQCLSSWANCNGAAILAVDDGCETYLDALNSCKPGCVGTPVICPATQVCNAGSCGAAQGLTVLSVPFTTTAQDQRYAHRYSPAPDLTNATMTLRMYAPGATAGSILFYFSDASTSPGGGTTLALADIAAGWKDVTFQVGGVLGDYDPSALNQLTMEVLSGDAGPWTNPTVIYIDSIRSSNLLVNDTFNSTFGGMFMSANVFITGATMAWANSVP